MLNITNHQGNVNQNHNGILPYTFENGYYQKDKSKQVLGMDVEKRKPLYILGGNVNCCSNCKKTVWRSLKKLKIEYYWLYPLCCTFHPHDSFYNKISTLKKKRFYLFLEGKGGRKREGETSMCGCLSCAPYWGPDLQPRHVPWLGIDPATLCFSGLHSIFWATWAKATQFALLNPLIPYDPAI